jgi:hypothetical protein
MMIYSKRSRIAVVRFFAVLLFIYEMLNIGFMEYCRDAYKKQMGFLYKPFTRGLFLIL